MIVKIDIKLLSLLLSLFFAALAISLPSVANGSENAVIIGGYVKSYGAALINGEGDIASVKNSLNLNFEYGNSDETVALKANPYINNYPTGEGKYEIGFREIYIDLYFENIDIRVGKQQVIWGKADGVFITDIVSPKDMSQFLLPEFEEIRMGVTGVKLNYYLGTSTFELVWLPLFTASKMPENDSIWGTYSSFPENAEIDYSEKNITPSLKNSEIFLKYSIISSFMDIELMGGFMWDDTPTMHGKIEVINGLTKFKITPKHNRIWLAGGSFSKDIMGLFLLRGEAAYYKGKNFNPNKMESGITAIEKDYMHYLTGIDAKPLLDINMSLQLIMAPSDWTGITCLFIQFKENQTKD